MTVILRHYLNETGGSVADRWGVEATSDNLTNWAQTGGRISCSTLRNMIFPGRLAACLPFS